MLTTRVIWRHFSPFEGELWQMACLLLDQKYLKVKCIARAALPSNGIYLLCSWAQYPVELCALTPSCSLILPSVLIREMWPVVRVSNSAEGTVIELWLTCCLGNCYSVGQKCFYLPVLHKQSGWSVWVQTNIVPSSSIAAQIQMDFQVFCLVEEVWFFKECTHMRTLLQNILIPQCLICWQLC